jgi:hypothetical protein
VETLLARSLIAGEVPEGSNVAFAIENDELSMTVVPAGETKPQKAR